LTPNSAAAALPQNPSLPRLKADFVRHRQRRCVDPQLTAADVPALEMGATGVQLLTERIVEPNAAPKHTRLFPPISLRISTAPAPGAGV
jgi:DNA-binding LacI/PurR family transcriptional regulator